MLAEIPVSHRDLLTGTAHGVLTTLMPDGTPQSSVVWVDYDGCYVRISTTLERQKGRNMRANPYVSLLVIDPCNGSRFVSITGDVVALMTEGAEALADCLTRRYTGKSHFYGDIYPAEQREKETRVIALIAPVQVMCDAIFK